jgi:hypothetical protein
MKTHKITKADLFPTNVREMREMSERDLLASAKEFIHSRKVDELIGCEKVIMAVADRLKGVYPTETKKFYGLYQTKVREYSDESRAA